MKVKVKLSMGVNTAKQNEIREETWKKGNSQSKLAPFPPPGESRSYRSMVSFDFMVVIEGSILLLIRCHRQLLLMRISRNSENKVYFRIITLNRMISVKILYIIRNSKIGKEK